MGILHSIKRFLGWKTEDEEDESPVYPYPILHRRRQDRYGDSSSFSERLRNMFSFHSLIYKAGKGLLQIARFIFYLRRPRRKTADPVLPIQNPAPSVHHDPLFLQALVISSPGDDSSVGSAPETAPAACAPVADFYTDFTYSLASEEMMDSENVLEESTAGAIVDRPGAFIEEIAQANVPDSLENKQSTSEVQEEEKVVVNERWIKHYGSCHRILLVGEGDFSFSTCLATAFGLAFNIIATSLDSREFLEKHYRNAPFNIAELRIRGCKVMHGIDATKMATHELLGHLTFDRIIFNFPFAGFFKNLSRQSQLRRHRRLVSQFLKNAKEMISEDGEIHISHKTNDFHIEWKLESVASSHRLRLIEAVNFNHLDYPGYNTKCGFGGDNNFNCNPSKTYKFGLKYY
ncbi:hypothetical protein Salat_0300800 [Sesamum alatum]|uniref:25S rRNA (uridine-N(3))-methyltransferase BMT5-like domain-containing protein n=1 Tax=Sesamum alatum TaxID=300844 RepID=A0AAE1Z0J5_9LAMI|nr:hypothetical protein Salat_0300800 [Sesamum alatum]